MKSLIVSTLVLVIASMNAAIAAESSDARREEVRSILREVPLIDGHNDVPWEYRQHSNDFSAIDLSKDTSGDPLRMATDIPRLRAGCVGGQFWSVYVPTRLKGADAVQATVEQIDVVHWMCARYQETFELALTANDVERIHRNGKIASLIGMEGGHSINNSLGTLRMMYRLGARYMTLTHTSNTDWADAAGDKAQHHGLTPFGKDVVREMNRLGMMVDLSHVTDDVMRDAISVSKAPVIFSHSSARAICNHARNVPDDVLKLTAANGGVVMVCFLPGYVVERDRDYFERIRAERDRLREKHGEDQEKITAALAEWRKTNPDPNAATLGDVANHIDHIRKAVGVDYIGIGSDFDGFRGAIRGLEDVSKYPDLFVELLRRGYSKEDIKKIAGSNILRVMRATERVASELQSPSPAN